MNRRLFTEESAYEKAFGYSRAVRVGPWISVAGTTAMARSGPVGGADVVAQATEALRRIAAALDRLDATLQDVVRTRVYLADIADWERVGAVHAGVFAEVRPAYTVVQSALVDERLLVEIEADAVVAADGRTA